MDLLKMPTAHIHKGVWGAQRRLQEIHSVSHIQTITLSDLTKTSASPCPGPSSFPAVFLPCRLPSVPSFNALLGHYMLGALQQAIRAGEFSFEDLLLDEAFCLSRCAPVKDAPKRPNASKSELTQEAQEGRGDAHCVVSLWPAENTPEAWGERNRTHFRQHLSDTCLQELEQDERLSHLVNTSKATRLSMLLSNDEGCEEEYRGMIGDVLERVTAIAYIFLHHEWRKSENAMHADFHKATETLAAFSVKLESTSRDTGARIRTDINIHIPRQSPLPPQKAMPGTSLTTAMHSINAKSPAIAEHLFVSPLHSLSVDYTAQSVDEAVNLCLLKVSSSEKSWTISELHQYLLFAIQENWPDKKTVWPLMATGLFSQVRF